MSDWSAFHLDAMRWTRRVHEHHALAAAGFARDVEQARPEGRQSGGEAVTPKGSSLTPPETDSNHEGEGR